VSLVREIEWDACLLEPREAPAFMDRYRRATGRSDRSSLYFAGNPWLEDALISFSVALETRVALDPELADLVGLVVSQDNSCRYCFAVTRAFLLILGMSEVRIARLEQTLLSGEFSERERAALDFARRVSRSNPLPGPADVEALRRLGFGELEIAEISGVVGLHVFFNRLATLSALPPQRMESLPERWWVRLLRPLMAVRLGRIRRRSPSVALTAAEREGPFSPAVVALDGLPLAGTLRQAIDGLWRSEVLSQRSRGLVFAVVGRALGCPLSEDEGRRSAEAGGLSAPEIEHVLGHLSSPALDPVERIVVPFARETVWYQPAQIQRRARAVKEHLTRDQFVELIATAALANALCRIAAVAEASR